MKKFLSLALSVFLMHAAGSVTLAGETPLEIGSTTSDDNSRTRSGGVATTPAFVFFDGGLCRLVRDYRPR